MSGEEIYVHALYTCVHCTHMAHVYVPLFPLAVVLFFCGVTVLEICPADLLVATGALLVLQEVGVYETMRGLLFSWGLGPPR